MKYYIDKKKISGKKLENFYYVTIEEFRISSLNGDRKMFDALTYQEMLREKNNSEKYGIINDRCHWCKAL